MVQLLTFAKYAPPPASLAVLAIRKQLFRVPDPIPPPYMALLFVITQQATTALEPAHQAPPPVSSGAPIDPLRACVAPFRSVNPFKRAPFVNHAQRTANVPFVAAG